MQDIKISLLLPTRGRPGLVRRFLDSVVATAFYIDKIEVVLRVDIDDKSRHLLDLRGVNSSLIVGAPTTMGEYNIQCLAKSVGQIIMLVNDDVVIRSPGWDKIIIDKSKFIS